MKQATIRQKKTNKDTKKGTRGGHGFSRDQVEFWKSRIRPRTTGDLQVRIKRAGKEAWFNLETQNQNTAARKARDIWLYLVAKGWDETLKKFKPASVLGDDPNFGEVFAALEKIYGVDRKRTFEGYRDKLRTMLAEIFGIHAERKYKSHHKKSAKWRARVDALRFSRLTKEKVLAWRDMRILRAGEDARKRRAAKHTADSTIRCSKSLLCPENLKEVKGLEIPEVLPFEGIKLGTVKNRYHSKIDAGELLQAIRKDLRKQHPEQYKIFLLATFAGLRRGEIDMLRWNSVLADKIIIEVHESFLGKTETSLASVDVDPEVIKELSVNRTGEFVVRGEVQPIKKRYDGYYRCTNDYTKLCVWLRANGMGEDVRSPIHTLRKEFGSIINEKHGIHKAMQMLRHSSIQVTQAFYADNRNKAALKMSELLAS